MKILTNTNNIVIEIAEEIEEKDNGFYLPNENRLIFKEYKSQDDKGIVTTDKITLINVDVPDYVEVDKYCYTSLKGFYENPDYVEPPKPVDERLTIAEDSITEIELALTEIYEGGI